MLLSQVGVVERRVVVPGGGGGDGDGDVDGETESQGFLDVSDGVDSNRAGSSPPAAQDSGTSMAIDRPSSAPQLDTNTAITLHNLHLHLTTAGSGAPQLPTTPSLASGETITALPIEPQSPFATTAQDFFVPTTVPGPAPPHPYPHPHPQYQHHTLPPDQDLTPTHRYHATLRSLGYAPRDERGAVCGPGQVQRFVQDPLPSQEYARVAVERGMRYLGVGLGVGLGEGGVRVPRVRLPVVAARDGDGDGDRDGRGVGGEGDEEIDEEADEEGGQEADEEVGQEADEDVSQKAAGDVVDEGYAPIKRWRSHSWAAPEEVMWQDVDIWFYKEI